jgi:hypothetical protein
MSPNQTGGRLRALRIKVRLELRPKLYVDLVFGSVRQSFQPFSRELYLKVGDGMKG